MPLNYVGIGEASKILGLSKTSIQKLVDSNQLAAVKTTGGHRRILRSSIDALDQKIGPKAMLKLEAASRQNGLPPSTNALRGGADELNVLIVEDDAATSTALVGVLAKNYPEIKCLVATDGLDAVLKLERMRPKILITDLRMEPFDGFSLLKMVYAREEYRSLATIVISGMNEKEIQKRGGLPANVLFFRKPVNMDRLLGFMDAYVLRGTQGR